MSRARDLTRLQELAALMRDHRLGQLREAASRRAQSLEQIAALEQPATTSDLPAVTAGLVALRYGAWADRRRGELNVVLARQTADWITAQEAAQKAFGQAEALRGLQGRPDRKG
jgi:hypothetical protein